MSYWDFYAPKSPWRTSLGSGPLGGLSANQLSGGLSFGQLSGALTGPQLSGALTLHDLHTNPGIPLTLPSPRPQPRRPHRPNGLNQIEQMFAGMAPPPPAPSIDLASLMNDAQVNAIADSMIRAQNMPLRSQAKQVRRQTKQALATEKGLQKELAREQNRIRSSQKNDSVAFAKTLAATRDKGQDGMEATSNKLDSLTSMDYSPEIAKEIVAAEIDSRGDVGALADANLQQGMSTAQATADLLKTGAASAARNSVDKRGDLQRSGDEIRRGLWAQIAANRAQRPAFLQQIASQVADDQARAYNQQLQAWQAQNGFQMAQLEMLAKSQGGTGKQMSRSALAKDLRNSLFTGTGDKRVMVGDYANMKPYEILDALYPTYADQVGPRVLIAALRGVAPGMFTGVDKYTRWDPKAKRFFRKGTKSGKG